MIPRKEKVDAFRALHEAGCFIVPNPWDVAGARMMVAAGFKALATTSSGFAFSKGRKDGAGEISRDESLAYAAEIAAATDLPVTADLEDGYAETPQGVAETVRLAAEAGLAGLSIEDRQPDPYSPIRGYEDAVARAACAADAARRHDIVLTARADGLSKGAYGLDEAIRRLRSYEAAGAEVLYAPAVPDLEALRMLCASVERPVNHLVSQGVTGLSVAQIAEAGVRRISVGGSLARAVAGAMLKEIAGLAAGNFAGIENAPPWSALRSPRFAE